MSMQITVQCMALLGIVWTAAGVTFREVVQLPKYLKVNRGENASMHCAFPLDEDLPDVRWWRREKPSFLEPDSRKRFDVNKGSGSLQFLNVTFADSGVYYCKVNYREKSNVTGTGTQLTVYVPPTPLKMVPIEENSAISLKFECQTAAFYPEDFRISWQRDGVEILTGIETVKSETTEGLFEVSSSLADARPVLNGVVYTCLVSHISLKGPASVSYTVIQDHSFRNIVIPRLVLGFLIILGLLGIIVDHVRYVQLKSVKD
ncbi:tyrosine-protein phosphatase non-receptor type substrate 1-like isoform X2 [Scyliorhinus canicula]|uniref:tyrosine-protein phosphatase non-receptor type substrate 1-like isoform X2 n=1 Tax=Scyliorhinus canicula TaxID=7830 RepID=UPI0018F4EBB9|nr:tyrosine-protein phosphatase non-receptor type substrate 1-like isoform X2 [Scyliorhinus canicula]